MRALASHFWVALRSALRFFSFRAVSVDLVLGDGVLDVEVGVPDVEDRLGGEGAHRGAVALHGGQGRLAALACREPVVPSGHDEAGSQPLDIPFEGPGQGLVEVVDVEDQAALRRGVGAEVGQVRVAAQLGSQPRRRGGRQVGGHHQSRAPVEGERRHQHPAVADRHQLGNRVLAWPSSSRPGLATRQAGTRRAPPTGLQPGPPSPTPPAAQGSGGCPRHRRPTPTPSSHRVRGTSWCSLPRQGHAGVAFPKTWWSDQSKVGTTSVADRASINVASAVSTGSLAPRPSSCTVSTSGRTSPLVVTLISRPRHPYAKAWTTNNPALS